MEYDISNLLPYINIPIDEINNCIKYFLMYPTSISSIEDINKYFSIEIETPKGVLIAKEKTIESYMNLIVCSSLPRKMSGKNKKICIRKEEIVRYKILDTYEYFISYEDFYNKLKMFTSPEGLEFLWNIYNEKIALHTDNAAVEYYTKKLSNVLKKIYDKKDTFKNDDFQVIDEVLYVNKDFIFVDRNGIITLPISFEKGICFFNRYLKKIIKGEKV